MTIDEESKFFDVVFFEFIKSDIIMADFFLVHFLEKTNFVLQNAFNLHQKYVIRNVPESAFNCKKKL